MKNLGIITIYFSNFLTKPLPLPSISLVGRLEAHNPVSQVMCKTNRKVIVLYTALF